MQEEGRQEKDQEEMSAGLISCIMATRPGRIGMAQRALINFHDQTYPDKELIIASSHRFNMPDELAHLAVAPNVRWVGMDKQSTVADCMTKGFQVSSGEWVTFWDDDNLWHPRRLARQVFAVEDAKEHPCLIRDNMLAFLDTREIFICLRRNFDAKFVMRSNPYSLLIHRDYFMGFPRSKADHPIVASVGHYPEQRAKPLLIPFEWKMGVVGVRGDNIRGYSEHRGLVTRPRVVMSVDWLLSMEEELKCSIDQIRWWEPGTWHVCGLDGVAFSHEVTNAHGVNLNPVGEPDDDVVRESQEV